MVDPNETEAVQRLRMLLSGVTANLHPRASSSLLAARADSAWRSRVARALSGRLLEGASEAQLGPDACYERTEAISLAFMTALQLLPPRQIAVLLLREALGFHANEVTEMLDTSVEAVSRLGEARGLTRAFASK